MITVKTEVETHGAKVPVDMVFAPDDPARVNFTFHTDEDSDTEWTFGRDLLNEAMNKGYSGEGDVRFLVVDNQVKMGLSSPEGHGYVLFGLEIIEEFVELIYEEVPEGEDVYEIPDGVPEDWDEDGFVL